MNKLHYLWIIPLSVALSPISFFVIHAVTDSYAGIILPMIGLCVAAAGGGE